MIEDACQQAWAQLVRYRHRVALESAPRWLTKTAVREAVRLVCRRRRECSLELLIEDGAGTPDLWAALEHEEVVAHRDRLLDVRSLPARQQRMVWLKAFGLSYDELALHERCTFRTVERQLTQARHRLRVLP